MAIFRFALQPALDRALADEAAARALIVDARLACDGAVEKLAAVEARLDAERARRAALRDAGGLAASDAAAIALSLLYRQRAIIARDGQAVLARARHAYATLANARGALESLRERRLAEHRHLAERAELAETDEMNTLRSNTSAPATDGAPTALRSRP